MAASYTLGRLRESPPAAALRNIRERRRRVEWPPGAPGSSTGDRVAIVVVNHNTRALISGLVFSLYRVLGRDQFATLVVVDNASSDGSLETLTALADAGLIHLIANARQRYHGSGLNQAISWLASRQATVPGSERVDYVWALDSDTLVLRPDVVANALEQFRQLGPDVIGESFGELDGYPHFPLCSLMFAPARLWRAPVDPFADDGRPAKRFLETAVDAGRHLTPFPFLHHSYVLHLGEGTLIEVADREQRNRFSVWARRDLAGRDFTYTGHPLGPHLHDAFMTAYRREVPNGTAEQLVQACQREERITISDARPLPPQAELQRLQEEGVNLSTYLLEQVAPPD